MLEGKTLLYNPAGGDEKGGNRIRHIGRGEGKRGAGSQTRGDRELLLSGESVKEKGGKTSAGRGGSFF